MEQVTSSYENYNSVVLGMTTELVKAVPIGNQLQAHQHGILMKQVYKKKCINYFKKMVYLKLCQH